MYVEMTSFAIPTFLITALKVIGLVALAWLIVACVIVAVFHKGD